MCLKIFVRLIDYRLDRIIINKIMNFEKIIKLIINHFNSVQTQVYNLVEQKDNIYC